VSTNDGVSFLLSFSFFFLPVVCCAMSMPGGLSVPLCFCLGSGFARGSDEVQIGEGCCWKFTVFVPLRVECECGVGGGVM
jgi:hypothetical protein